MVVMGSGGESTYYISLMRGGNRDARDVGGFVYGLLCSCFMFL